ncbi:uncharacterized protein MYCFIDRAFT_179399 [Pseudocercospora fijiensis CIRAD86]|uniref:RING-type domain-containing protein n=1 Tax=Pseudocercospora fijiensis (strain CIRAD86) TaxID=383855 RepID=M3AKE6_PSEFD|nr:uncharacterized protein MYCFIDRAFT_179399 [Pseudocercospora fijiensis CIRAD86]EME77942.1 hypothetical protein MYCFIDRAFT_179399 [Pseudocercospora fijiensis CIRAD86]
MEKWCAAVGHAGPESSIRSYLVLDDRTEAATAQAPRDSQHDFWIAALLYAVACILLLTRCTVTHRLSRRGHCLLGYDPFQQATRTFCGYVFCSSCLEKREQYQRVQEQEQDEDDEDWTDDERVLFAFVNEIHAFALDWSGESDEHYDDFNESAEDEDAREDEENRSGEGDDVGHSILAAASRCNGAKLVLLNAGCHCYGIQSILSICLSRVHTAEDINPCTFAFEFRIFFLHSIETHSVTSIDYIQVISRPLLQPNLQATQHPSTHTDPTNSMAADLPPKEVFLTLITLNIDPHYHDECPVCMEDTKQATSTACNHTFCWECIGGWAQTHDTCPMCRAKLWQDHNVPIAPLPAQAPAPVPAPAAIVAPAPEPAPAPAVIVAPAPPPPPAAQHEVIVIDDDEDELWPEDEDPHDDDPNDGDYIP